MKQSLRRAHSTTWKVMAVVIPLILVLSLFIRQDPGKLEQPQLIDPPANTTSGGDS